MVVRATTISKPPSVLSVCFTRDNNEIAFALEDSTTFLWDRNMRMRSRLRFNEGPEDSWGSGSRVAISPQGAIVHFGFLKSTLLATAEQDNTLIWSRLGLLGLGEYAKLYHPGMVQSLSFSPNKRYLAIGCEMPTRIIRTEKNEAASTIQIWNIADIKANSFFPPTNMHDYVSDRGSVHNEFDVYSIAFSPDSKTLAASGYVRDAYQREQFGGKVGGIVSVWDVATGRNTRQLRKGKQPIKSVTFSHDSKLVAIAADQIHVFNWQNADREWSFGDSFPYFSVAFSPKNSYLAAGGKGGDVQIWDVAKQRKVAILQGPKGDIYSIAYSHQGDAIAAGGRDGKVYYWQLEK